MYSNPYVQDIPSGDIGTALRQAQHVSERNGVAIEVVLDARRLLVATQHTYPGGDVLVTVYPNGAMMPSTGFQFPGEVTCCSCCGRFHWPHRNTYVVVLGSIRIGEWGGLVGGSPQDKSVFCRGECFSSAVVAGTIQGGGRDDV